MLEVSVEKANYYVQCLEEVLDEYENKKFSRLDKSNLAEKFFEKRLTSENGSREKFLKNVKLS